MIAKSISIGPLTFHLYGIIIAIGILAGWYVAQKRAHLYKIPKSLLEDPILLLPLVLSIVGARIYHVWDYWSFYRNNLWDIINITNGGLGIWGGLIGIFVGFYIVAKVKKVNLISILDLAAPSLLLGQSIGRIGNYINKEGFGPPTQAPWGVYIPPEDRPLNYINFSHFHPTFFYEAIIDLIFFFLLIFLAKKFNKPAQAFALYLILYSIGRFAVEFYRIDTATVDTIKVAQVLSVIAFFTGIVIFARQKKAKIRG